MSTEAATGALHPFSETLRHHLALDLLQLLIADGFPRLVLQGYADLVVRDPAAVLAQDCEPMSYMPSFSMKPPQDRLGG